MFVRAFVLFVKYIFYEPMQGGRPHAPQRDRLPHHAVTTKSSPFYPLKFQKNKRVYTRINKGAHGFLRKRKGKV